MKSKEENYTYVQCQTCGRIFRVKQCFSAEEIYIPIECNRCHSTTGLNLGHNILDIYEFYNPSLDGRYYTY